MSSASADRRRLGAFAAALAALLLSPDAAAQGCAACRNSAEQSGNAGAINTAILVLLFPTLLIFAGIVYRAYRHR
jgi:hypothetical protein